MRKSNKTIAFLVAISLGLMTPTSSVLADTVSIDWVFKSTRPTKFAAPGYKNDMEQNYYITINGGNVSSSNIFGASVRDLNTDTYAAKYRLHKGLKYSQPYPYDQRTVNMREPYQLRGKKDTSSTSSSNLEVYGKVTY